MDIINPYIHGSEAAPAAFDGFGNRSRDFNGVDDEVIIPDSPSFPTGAQTWSCWVKPSRLTFGASGQDMMSKWGSQGANELSAILFLSNTGLGKPQLYISDNGSNVFLVASSDPLTVDTWHHVVGVFTPNTSMKIYVDGVLKGTNTTSIPAAIHNSSVDFVIGWRDFTFESHFKGNICDCRIYDTDLTATDISDLYNGTNITTNLVGHWLTDADDVEDKAGSNNGTNYGTKYSYDNPSPPVEFGRASRDFNGTTDHVDLGNSTEFSFSDGVQDEPFSLCAWIKCDDNGTFRVLSKDNGTGSSREWLLSTDSGGNLNVYLIDSGIFRGREYTTPLPENEWLHVSATYDGSGGANFRLGLKLYVNGVKVDNADFGTGGYVAMTPNTNDDVFIGRYATTYADGKIADVRIYDAELTASQVSDLYAGTDVQTNLVGHWLTDNDDVEDKAGTNDGTNFGSTYSYDNPPMDLVPSRQASRSFDGVNDYITVQDGSWIPTGAQTWACWIKPDADSIVTFFNHNVGSGNQRSVNIITFTGGVIYAQLSPDGVTTIDAASPSSTYVTGEWIHVAFTFTPSSSTGLKLYINGSLETVSNVSSISSVFNSTADVGIGANALGQAPFQGNICDCRIYDTDLTASQILAIYNGTTDRTNLVGQWLTNSDDVLDHAGTNDGTNLGSTYSNDSPS